MEWKGSYKEVKAKLKGQMFRYFHKGKSNVPLTSKSHRLDNFSLTSL